MLRDPHHNKGLAFTEKERDAHYLRGLLPPVVVTQELQVDIGDSFIRLTFFKILCIAQFGYVQSQEKKLMHNLRQYDVPLHKYMALMELEVISTNSIWFVFLFHLMNFNECGLSAITFN